MHRTSKWIIVIMFVVTSLAGWSQANSLEISADKEKAFTPYMYWRHGGPEGVLEFKKTQPHEYLKELWYYSESFTVKRNYLQEGVTLDPSIIDISRFESSRKAEEDFILVLPGFRDALVLLAGNKLIYKPGTK